MSLQLKSKARVANHGEVFTAKREVNAMLDLVKDETNRIESRFLEPACGTGNFLIEVLCRKLNAVEKRYKKNQTDFERYAIIAVSSIYGIDLLEDNIFECRERLLCEFDELYSKLYKKRCNEECKTTIRYILTCNIIQGDALSLLNTHNEPIIFSEWSPINSTLIKRRDYIMDELTETQFTIDPNLLSDEGERVFIPKPIKEYPLTHYLRLYEHA